jgi:hypothetical protein
MTSLPSVSRRAFIRRTTAAGAGLLTLPAASCVGKNSQPSRRLRVAAIVTELTYRSHAHVILENFTAPYLFNGKWANPGMDIVSLYMDQVPANDLGHAFAEKYHIPIYKSIDEALCCGGDKLAVDAVLSIGEHGKYPTNSRGQVEYPRARFFNEIVSILEKNKTVVPVFTDKHLAYNWELAKGMYDTAQRLRIPLMAGSSVPLAQRQPPFELPGEARIQEAVSIHGGGIESYDFHALEVLQSIVEARRGGETGVARVQFLKGDPLWKAADDGLWSPTLAQAALDAEPNSGRPAASKLICRPKEGEPSAGFVSHGILINYRDGLRGLVLAAATGGGTNWHFACRLAGEQAPRATSLYVGPWNNRNLFKAFDHAIQTFFRERRAPYPVERTLLTTGIIDAEMESYSHDSKPIDTPNLSIHYKPKDFSAFRETGASWKILTEDIPEPRGIKLWKP